MIQYYENKIYPLDLFVCIGETAEKLNRKFRFYRTLDGCRAGDPNEEATMDPQIPLMTGCTTLARTKDKYGIPCVVITLNTDMINIAEWSELADTIAHESTHAADAIFDYIYASGQSFDNGNEPYAYLLGYIAGRIANTVITWKEKNTTQEK